MVTGELDLDLSDLNWQTPDPWAEIGLRFTEVLSGVPDGVGVVIRLPKVGVPLSFSRAFVGWQRLPRFTFRIIGPSYPRAAAAVADLRSAMDAWHEQQLAAAARQAEARWNA